MGEIHRVFATHTGGMDVSHLVCGSSGDRNQDLKTGLHKRGSFTNLLFMCYEVAILFGEFVT